MASHEYVRLGEKSATSRCCGCCKRWSRAQKALCAGVVCSVLVVVLSAAYAFSRFVVDQKIADAVLLKNGSTTEKEWEHPTVPLYNKYYFLDVTNAYEVQTTGAKPSFTERGPYVYREYRLKENVEWSENEEIVSYLPIDYFIFDRNMSVGDPMEDQVTTINYILMSALNFLNGTALQKDPDIEKLVALILSLLQGESLLITRSVHDFLWGYEDSILKIVSKFMDNIPSKFPLQNNVTTANPQAISRIRTGVNNLDGLGQFVVWNNMTYLPYWNGSKAQELKGTEGFFFKPGVGKEPLYVFVDFLFRSGYFSYSQNERVKGIDVYRFAIPKVEMGNTSIDPANAGYYSYGPSGLFNMSSCYPMNPPIFLSKPHFLDCSSSVLEAVEGLQPVRALHDSFLDVEPMTGILFSGVKRIQTNIHVQRDKNIWQLETVPTLYFPIFWVEETGEITDHLLHKFKSSLFTPVTVMSDVLIGLIIASGLGAVLCFLLAAWFKFSDHAQNYAINTDNIDTDDDDDDDDVTT